MISGILNLYKEKGYTSHDVVAKLRGIVGQKKIGHTGTLDPDAEGVLPVCLGRATKVCDLLTDKDKTYEAVLLLGRTTDTQDVTGQILSERPLVSDGREITPDAARACVMSFEGEYDQVPPMYSALKVNGKKLYELAREGKTVERRSRKVAIRRIRIMEVSLPHIRMEVECSKGTYIRTLCHDIGEKLGCGGCMESLLRTRVGGFVLADSHKLGKVEEMVRSGRLDEILIPTDRVFDRMHEIRTCELYDRPVHNGTPAELHWLDAGTAGAGAVFEDDFEENERVRLYDSSGIFVGVYRYDPAGKRFRPEKMFYDPDQPDRR